MVEARLVQLHLQEPAEQQVIVELLAQQPLAAHRVSAISSEALSRRSGGIDGLPVALYIRSKLGDSNCSTASASCLMRRSGWSRGTRCSRFNTINIDRCCRSSPRIRRFLLLHHSTHCLRRTIHQFVSGVFQQPARPASYGGPMSLLNSWAVSRG